MFFKNLSNLHRAVLTLTVLMILSTPALAQDGNEALIKSVFQENLKRDPMPNELEHYKNQIRNFGMTREELGALVADYPETRFVQSYESTNGKPPDANARLQFNMKLLYGSSAEAALSESLKPAAAASTAPATASASAPAPGAPAQPGQPGQNNETVANPTQGDGSYDGRYEVNLKPGAADDKNDKKDAPQASPGDDKPAKKKDKDDTSEKISSVKDKLKEKGINGGGKNNNKDAKKGKNKKDGSKDKDSKGAELAQRILKSAQNLIGSTAFRGADVAGGRLACAKVVSTALRNAGAISSISLNVRSLVSDLKNRGWKEVKPPYKDGDVVTWMTYDYTGDGRKDPDTHVGVVSAEKGGTMAISNSSSLRYPRKTSIYYAPITRVLRAPGA